MMSTKCAYSVQNKKKQKKRLLNFEVLEVPCISQSSKISKFTKNFQQHSKIEFNRGY